jgi:basic amino acid/polyamine antiporter, APA family
MSGALQRRLGTGDAVVLGLGSMVGAGVFAVWAPAAAAAGSWLLLGLAAASVVAWCNARSSAALAVRYPTSGGTYVYGREQLGPWWGFAAGWSFVVGKTASCAAMALTVGNYLWPAHARPVGVAAVLTLAAVTYCGITRTAGLTRVLLAGSLTALAVVVVAAVTGDATGAGLTGSPPGGARGVLEAGGLLFFAFAGYARIATLAEEVRDPARTIPRAVAIALSLAVLVYGVVGVTVLGALGPARLAASVAPLADTLRTAAGPGLGWVVAAGAVVAASGALLALIAGVGRTVLAMARQADLPGPLAAVHPRFATPHRAEVLVAVLVSAAVMVGDLRSVIGFSSFGVLLYYAIANASAWTLPERHRPPRAVPAAGVAGCLVLAATLPMGSVVGGLGTVLLGLLGRAVAVRRRGARNGRG